MHWNVMLDQSKKFDSILIPTLALPTENLHQTLSEVRPVKKILVLIGPEGDFTKQEAEQAVSMGAVPISLGSLVMRTETAAMYILSVLNFWFRRSG